MTKSNPATKLAKEIVNDLGSYLMAFRLAQKEVTAIAEDHLQPTFDLLKRIHELADEGVISIDRFQILREIELLTREYDNETQRNVGCKSIEWNNGASPGPSSASCAASMT